MAERPTIGAIVIARNEEANLADCLASLAFCDQIVVVDGGSTDRSVEIAREAGAEVTVRPDWEGFGAQKQRALDLATTDWVLSIDADERVSDKLGGEILAAAAAGARAGYRLNRLSMFLGRFMRHGGWYPDRIVRLARRDACRFSDAVVHEELVVEGPLGTLNAPLIHYSYQSVDDVLRKLRHYALASAQVRRQRGKRGGLAAACLRGMFVFVKVYLLQAGLLDGSAGFIAAVYRSQEVFWRNIALGRDERP